VQLYLQFPIFFISVCTDIEWAGRQKNQSSSTHPPIYKLVIQSLLHSATEKLRCIISLEEDVRTSLKMWESLIFYHVRTDITVYGFLVKRRLMSSVSVSAHHTFIFKASLSWYGYSLWTRVQDLTVNGYVQPMTHGMLLHKLLDIYIYTHTHIHTHTYRKIIAFSDNYSEGDWIESYILLFHMFLIPQSTCSPKCSGSFQYGQLIALTLHSKLTAPSSDRMARKHSRNLGFLKCLGMISLRKHDVTLCPNSFVATHFHSAWKMNIKP
jgi:hypothetical protein